MANRREKMETVTYFIFLFLKSLQTVTATIKLRCLLLGSKATTNLGNVLKSRESYGFSSNMYGSECWTIKKTESWRLDTFKLVLVKTVKSPLNSKEPKPVNPKGNQPWIFIDKTMFQSWPPHAKSRLIVQDLNDEKDWRRKVKWAAEDGMVG